MALEGTVKDFGLSEIFQLIAIQKKSGLLSVSGDRQMAIFFKDGAIISTRDRRSLSYDPLRDFLLRYGFIGRRELKNLNRIQAETKLDLTDILISEKYYTPEELSAIFAEQIQETIQEALNCAKSAYTFIAGNHVLSGVASFAALKVEGLLMESMRRIDEFPELTRIFPSESMILKRIAAPTEKAAELDRNETAVYALLEQPTSLGELIRRARMARFCTYESCKNLLEKGLLEIVAESAPVESAAPEEVIEDRGRTGGRLVPTLAAIVMLIASFAAGEYLVPLISPPGWIGRSREQASRPSLPGESALAASLDELSLRRLEGSLREGLEEYYALNGSYPFTLEVLVVRRFVPQEIVTTAQQRHLQYRLGDGGASYSILKD